MLDTAIPSRLPAMPGEVTGACMTSMIEMVLGVRLVFDARLDADVLRRATRLLLDLEPVLGAWYRPKRGGGEWVRCTGLDADIPFEVRDTPDPDGEAEAFHATPFEPKGPRFAVRLLRTPDHDEVCTKLDHVAGDGWSAKESVHLLAELYTQLVHDPAYAPEPRVEGRPTYAAVWEALTDGQRTAAGAPPMMPSTWNKHLPHGRGDAFHMRSMRLDPVRVAVIREYVHGRGATLNEGLVAALLRSAAHLGHQKKQEKLGFSLSADMRRLARHAPVDRIGMVATTQNVLIDYSEGEPYDDTLRRVVEGIKPFRDNLWGIGTNQKSVPPTFMRAIFGFLTTAARVMDYVGVLDMNLGAFDERRLSFGGTRPVSAIALSPIVRFPSFPAMISSYEGAVTISTSFRERHATPGVMEAWLAGTEAELAQLRPA